MEDKKLEPVKIEEENGFSNFIEETYKTSQKEEKEREEKRKKAEQKLKSIQAGREIKKQDRTAVIETIALLVVTTALTIGLFFLSPKFGVLSLGGSVLIMTFFLRMARRNNKVIEIIYEKASMPIFFVGLAIVVLGVILCTS